MIDLAISHDEGNGHLCAVVAASPGATSGPVRCRGTNAQGQLGVSAASRPAAMAASPVTVPGISDAVEVATSTSHTCARRASGQVWCWGGNAFGQLGAGDPWRARPVRVTALRD